MGQKRDMEKLVAVAIFEGLKRRNSGYVSGEPERGAKTTIDGKFYLMAVARHVLKTLDASPDK
jgi:hypothetical protein